MGVNGPETGTEPAGRTGRSLAERDGRTRAADERVGRRPPSTPLQPAGARPRALTLHAPGDTGRAGCRSG